MKHKAAPPAEGQGKPEGQDVAQGPLAGCKICITGFNDTEERAALPELVRSLGADFSADLYKTCTHLVAKAPSGEKYKYAVSWGIHVVSSAWLRTTLDTGIRQDEARFAVLRTVTRDAARAPGAAPAPPASHATVPPTSASGASTLAAEPAGHTRAASNPATGGSTAQGGAQGAAPSAGASAAQGCAGSASVGNGPRQGGGSGGSNGGGGGGGGSGAGAAPGGAEDGVAGLYLGCVRFHPVGMAVGEGAELRRLVAGCGALREPDLVPRVTHVLVGSEPSTSELQSVRDHMAEWRGQVKVVRLQWLRECCGVGRYVEPDAATLLTAAALMPKGAALMPAASLGGANGLSTSMSGSAWPLASSASMEPWDADTRSRMPDCAQPRAPAGALEVPLPSEPGQALRGLSFTLAAVRGTDTEQAATRLIRSQGGMLLGAQSFKLTGISNVYAICPHGMPDACVRDLERACKEFKQVPVQQRGTLYWLQECLRCARLIPPAVYGQPAFHPMPYALPLRQFEGVRVHISGYAPEQRKAITVLVELLGGQVTSEFSRHNSHLLVAHAAGKKYAVSVKWGVPAVSEHWIITSAYMAMPANVWMDKARPRDETREMLQVALQACRNRQAGGASTGGSQATQLPSTQLPPTQPPPTQPSAGHFTAHAPARGGRAGAGGARGPGLGAGGAGGPPQPGNRRRLSLVEVLSGPEDMEDEAQAALFGGGAHAGAGPPPPALQQPIAPGLGPAAAAGAHAGLPLQPPALLKCEAAATGAGLQIMGGEAGAAQGAEGQAAGPRGGASEAVRLQPPGQAQAQGQGRQGPAHMPPPPPRPALPAARTSPPAACAPQAAASVQQGVAATVIVHTATTHAPAPPAHAIVPMQQQQQQQQAGAGTSGRGSGAGSRDSEAPQGTLGVAGTGGRGTGGSAGSAAVGHGAVQLGQQPPVSGASAGAHGQQGQDGERSSSPESSQPGDDDLVAFDKIQQLLQAARPPPPVHGSCSQLPPPELMLTCGLDPSGNPGASGAKWGGAEGLQPSVSGREVSHVSHNSSGGTRSTLQEGDTMSRPRVGANGGRKRRATTAMEPPPPPHARAAARGQRGGIVTRRQSETQDDGLHGEMSQQVGYDAGQEAAERLTRNRRRSSGRGTTAAATAAAATAGGAAEGAADAQAAARMSLISRLRQRG